MTITGEFELPSPDVLKQEFLRDIELGAIEEGLSTDPPVGPGTDLAFHATALENVLQYALQNIAVGNSQHDVLNVTGERLDQIRRDEGLPELGATRSGGKLKLSVPQPEDGSQVTADVPAGTRWRLPGGGRVESLLTINGAKDGELVDVRAVDAGTKGNARSGTTATLVGTVINLAREAVVSDEAPLTGGVDQEKDERKRTRILNRHQNPIGHGSWGELREEALQANADIRDAYVYPCVGGNSTAIVALSRNFDRDQKLFTREVNLSQIRDVQEAYFKKYGSGNNLIVKSVDDFHFDAAFKLKLPPSAQSGGDGRGWTDVRPWPRLEDADAGRVIVSTATSSKQITVSANTSVKPEANKTTIAWWSRVDQKFLTAVVSAIAGTTGAWQLTLNSALTDSSGGAPAVGDFICPASVRMNEYGKSWLSLIESLGPHEVSEDPNQRCRRRPGMGTEQPAAWSDGMFCHVQHQNSEIESFSRSHSNALKLFTPASPATDPEVFVPRSFAIYQVT